MNNLWNFDELCKVGKERFSLRHWGVAVVICGPVLLSSAIASWAINQSFPVVTATAVLAIYFVACRLSRCRRPTTLPTRATAKSKGSGLNDLLDGVG